MKKILIMMMCVIMVVCFMPTVAIAAETEPEPTYDWYDNVNGDEFILSTAADLLGFAKKVNEDGVTFYGKTVKLGADVDLAGIEWVPVGQTNGYGAKTYFQGTFDGQNNTISNMTITNTNSGDNYAAGFFGFIDIQGAEIKNLVFDKATVTGHHNTAVVVGYLTGSVTNCIVKNSTVIATSVNNDADGDKVGGIAGCVNPNNSTSILNNNTVTNTTIKGYRDVGGIVGGIAGNEYSAIDSCNVQNTNVYYSTTDTVKRGSIYIGKRFEGFIGTGNKDTDCNVYVEVANANGLSTAIENAEECANICLTDDIALDSKLDVNKSVTIDGNSHRIYANAKINDHLLLITANATVKNVKLDSAKNAKGVHVYSQNTPVSASFDGVTFAKSTGSGLTVNGTTVSLKDVTFTESGWQDVNVDSGVGVTNDSILNVGTGCTFSHDYQITSDGQKGDNGRYGGKYGVVTLNDSAKTLAEKTVDVSAKDKSNVDYTYKKKVWTISDKPYIPPYVPTTPTTPTDNVTNSGSTATDNASTNADLSGSTSTSNGTTSATVDKTTADKIVDKAVENKSTEVVIDATANTTTAANSTTIAQVTIPTETLGAIAEKTEADVTIKTDVAEVKMDNAAAAAVSEQATGDTVQIVIEKVAEETDKVEFELKVVCSDGKVISNFNGGNIAVTVALPKAMAEKKVVCVYIDDNGHMSKVEGQKNADGTYTFVTGHFSSYAILSEEEADAAIAAQKEAIKNIKIKLTSKQVKTKSGKKGIKITWTAAAGDKTLDGVEVFRSKERNKGYGTEPFYTSTKGGNEGSYINTKSLKKGTKYYYRVRGYVLVDGQKVYTDYSTKAWRTVK